MMEITPGIYKIDGIRGANCYLAFTDSKLLLIDTGMPGSGKKIINYVKGLGKNPSDIEFVILTHADIDHIGSAARIKELTGAKLIIHSSDAPILSGKTGSRTVKGPLGILFRLTSLLIRFHPVEPDIILKGDCHIDGFSVIHTPGHTHGSISLYKPGEVIFVGDALNSDRKGNPRPLRKRNFLSADVAQAEASFMKISELEFDTLLPGHGAPVIGRASGKVKELLTSTKTDRPLI